MLFELVKKSITSGDRTKAKTLAATEQKQMLCKIEKYGNCSVGLRIYCADRKRTWRKQAKIPLPEAIFMDFCP